MFILNSSKYPTGAKCKVSFCDIAPKEMGYCHKHYLKIRSVTIASDDQRSCEFMDCKLLHYAKGLCLTHYTIGRTFKLYGGLDLEPVKAAANKAKV